MILYKKTNRQRFIALLLLLSPIFIQGVCSKEDAPSPSASDQFVTWTINGIQGRLATPVDSISQFIQGNATYVYGMTKPTPITAFGVAFEGIGPGTYPARYYGVFVGGKYYVPSTTPVQVVVTAYGSSGQFIEGTYSGNVRDSLTSAVLPVSGSFRVKVN
jgi:hypothetical protein